MKLNWELIDYQGKKVPHRFVPQVDSGKKLAVFLPGYNYSNDAPLLFYLRKKVYLLGYDVLLVDQRYHENLAFDKASDTEKDKWFNSDLTNLYAAIEKKKYNKILLVGKAMGSSGIVYLSQLLNRPKDVALVSLTPSLPGLVYQFLKDYESRAFVQAAQADPLWDAKMNLFFKGLLNCDFQLLPQVGHNYQTVDDPGEQLLLLKDAYDGVARFLEKLVLSYSE